MNRFWEKKPPKEWQKEVDAEVDLPPDDAVVEGD
jgi:hypothetical protein